ncbi:MAG TPA: TIGR03560 family F420-dependent LLM class oxidoreductase [Egibacteraceae bacterium]|nr:TIGR03560 family F420-dependent LLM class oxidoreductase [Egibacteraceae bacterium]
MDFGLDVAQHQLSWEELARRVRFAEDAGFTSVWVFDHFSPLYGDPRGPCLEGWTLLAALAATTERVRLGALVTGVTYRHPSVLVAQAVTVDHVSAGRLDFGLGAAWHAREHHALGIDFPPTGERIERLTEAIEVVRLLMTQDEAAFTGRHYRLAGATYRPRPVQRPHPPLWIGASGAQRMLPLAARTADVWHTFGSPAELARKARIVDEHAERAGRDPAAIRRATNVSLSQPPAAIRRDVEQRAERGFDYLIASWPEEGQGRVECFVEEIAHPLASRPR